MKAVIFRLGVLPQQLLARVLDDAVHLPDNKVKHDCVLGARAADGRDRPVVVDVLMGFGDGEATLQLEEETAEVTCLLAAPDERRAVDISILLIELDQLDFGVGYRCGLAQILVFDG